MLWHLSLKFLIQSVVTKSRKDKKVEKPCLRKLSGIVNRNKLISVCLFYEHFTQKKAPYIIYTVYTHAYKKRHFVDLFREKLS